MSHLRYIIQFALTAVLWENNNSYFTKHIICARHCCKPLVSNNSFNLHEVPIVLCFVLEDIEERKVLSNLLTVSVGGDKIRPQVVWRTSLFT